MSEIADRWLPGSWALELLHLGIRLHEVAIAVRSASQPDYDRRRPLEIVAELRESLNRMLAKIEPSGRNRELVLAYWERGVRDDLRPTLETNLGRHVAGDENGRNILLSVLKLYLPDPNYRTGESMSLYGAPALLLRVAELAGIDPHALFGQGLRELVDEL